jgi:hypothetical protein
MRLRELRQWQRENDPMGGCIKAVILIAFGVVSIVFLDGPVYGSILIGSSFLLLGYIIWRSKRPRKHRDSWGRY